MSIRLTSATLLALMACTPGTDRRAPADTDATDTDVDTEDGCDLGLACNPIPLDSFPAVDSRDTSEAPGATVDDYACAPGTDESGGEVFYAVTVPGPGILTADVDDGDADIDLHLLADTDPDSCFARAHERLAWYVEAGTWILVADTWVDGDGVPQQGAYTVTVDFLPTTDTDCAFDPRDLRMFWSDCAPGIDCYRADDDDGIERSWLRTPAWGPVVKEAHLVTPADGLPGGWPDSYWDGIPEHYALSEAATGWALDRDQPWAPDGEGNAHFGQGATGTYVPVEAEAWYLNMYWRDRPPQGTRLVVVEPFSKRAVIAAGGYETGPGSNEAIGGVVEEVHLYLDTIHRSSLILGFATDQSLSYGPVECW